MLDKKKQHSVSMRPSEWARLTLAAEARARCDGPTSTGYVVSTSRFMVDAALAEADRVLASYESQQLPLDMSEEPGKQALLFGPTPGK